MNVFKRLYAVEALDVRFKGKPERSLTTQSPKWKSPEFYIYYLAFLTIPPLMFKAVYDVSGPWHPSYKAYESLLEPGWIPGRLIDNSDGQYRGFRDNIPYMAALLTLHPLLRKAYESLRPMPVQQKPQTLVAADLRLERRIRFDFAFALVFVTALHGISAFKVLAILWLNYQIATALPKRYVPVATWTFNIAILFANELCRGYPFARVASFLLPTQTTQAGSEDRDSWGAWLDSYGGLIPRWEVLFNITVLRMISFNFDYLWSLEHRGSSPLEVCHSPSAGEENANTFQKKNLDPSNLSERDRVNLSANSADYSFRNFVAYALYAPLYNAGPILGFNDYISQSRYKLPSINRDRIIVYAVRFLLCLLTMELVQHYLYAVAIIKVNPDWKSYTPFQLSMLGYFNLHIVWLKLLLPWRLFRLWALLDGIDAPENMVRCMSDNFSTLAFWRGWHRSYNRWIVRYIYVPLGGSGKSKLRAALNYLAVFTFVALWHDINLRLLAWGWLASIFVLPEVIATLIFPAKKWKDKPNTYRLMSGAGAVFNILMLMVANLVGFVFGIDGLKGLMEGILNSFGGRVFFLAACGTLFIGAQMMFEIREAERRRGIDMKC